MPPPNMPTGTPQWAPTPWELAELELITSGALAPLDRFLGEADLAAIAERGELADGTPWPAPITLRVPESVAVAAVAAGRLELTDPEGVPLAYVAVDATWRAGSGQQGVAGKVEALAHSEFGAFRGLYKSPAAVRRDHPNATVTPVFGPLTKTDITVIRSAAERNSTSPLLLVMVGARADLGVSETGLIRTTLAAAPLIGDEVIVVAVRAPAVRGSADAWLCEHIAGNFAESTFSINPTEGELPTEVAAVVAQESPPPGHRGFTVFFTGLSGSGKSTLARALTDHVLERGDRTVTLLDGDVVRRHLSAGLGFSREDRETNIRRIGFVAAEIGRHRGMAICSPIAPFAATRVEVRAMHDAAGAGFVLVHVATPLEECERRDRKGLYAKARAGEIPDFTGISSPYEEPTDATVTIDTTDREVAECLLEVLNALHREGWLAVLSAGRQD
ncbi:MAG: adenylyl-sulfate kinase [Nocardioidaceae bacterium]